uniref:Uncharacterized protein n=1 Tax=Zooxanthella nutricula TaxID=1333877 RepID=A0A7S2MRU4_9DINO
MAAEGAQAPGAAEEGAEGSAAADPNGRKLQLRRPIARTIRRTDDGLPMMSYAVPQSLYGTTIMMPILVRTDTWQEWFRWKGMCYVWMVVNYAMQVIFVVGVRLITIGMYLDVRTKPDDCNELNPAMMAIGLTACVVALMTDIQETFDIHVLLSRYIPTVESSTVLKWKEEDGELKLESGGYSWHAKVMLYLFVLLPKLVLALVMMGWSLIFLRMSESDADIIKDATALVFIIETDEAIFSFFSLPEVRVVMDAVPEFEFQHKVHGPWTRPAIQFAKFLLVVGIVLFAGTRLHTCGTTGNETFTEWFLFSSF